MNNKQYNNIIEHTLINEQSAQTSDSLATARAIFDNMGVALPQGDMKTVYETIKTDDYMGWKSCTKEEAQTAADKGIAAIGINEDKIIVLSANDKEQPVAQTASVMTLNEDVSPLAVEGIEYYSYSCGVSECCEGIDSCKKDWNELVFSRLDFLYSLAQQYDSSRALILTLQFIRRKSYNSDLWKTVAGEIDQGFVDYVRSRNNILYIFFTTTTLKIYDNNGSPIDFPHLCATMNGIIVGGGTYWKALAVGKTHVRNLAGWAGDLQTLVVDAYVLTNASDNYEHFYNAFYQMIGNEQYSFGMKDLLADIDAFNFANNWAANYWQSKPFGTACKYYYDNIDIPGTGWSSRSNLRFSQFIGSDTKIIFADTVSNYTKQNWMLGIEWPLYESEAARREITLNLTQNQSNAAKNAFTDFIWQKHQAELSNA